MRRTRISSFFLIAFVVGAFVGLAGGLAFGGPADGGTSRVDPESENATTATPDSASKRDDPTASEPITAERAQAIGANELGQVLVLMYHLIDSKETEWTRTPENFRSDIALLKAEGFYPINLRDLASGNIDIPAGKSPVVITFDDSSPGQYRILDDGSIDPDSAVGILQAAVEEGDWAARASFFCLLDVVPKEREIFGQPERQQEKLRNLVDWGYEVGSHTVTHLNLSEASEAEAIKQLAQSQATLEELIGGQYAVTSISIPFGEYPADDSVLKSGEYEGIDYAYTAAARSGATPCPSPFSTDFDPLHIPRYRGSESYITDAIQNFKDNPGLRYVSDGDPTTVSAPAELAAKLGERAGRPRQARDPLLGTKPLPTGASGRALGAPIGRAPTSLFDPPECQRFLFLHHLGHSPTEPAFVGLTRGRFTAQAHDDPTPGADGIDLRLGPLQGDLVRPQSPRAGRTSSWPPILPGPGCCIVARDPESLTGPRPHSRSEGTAPHP